MTPPEDHPIDEALGLEVARAIVREHIGSSPRRVRRARGGLRNLVYEVDHAQGGFIVRMSGNPNRLSGFRKEQRVAARVRKASIPAPEIIHVGTGEHGHPYILQARAPGTEASRHPERGRVLTELGRLAAEIHSIHTRGFGASFGWENDTSPQTNWSEYLHHELKLEERLSVLQTHGMLSPSQAARVRDALNSVECTQASPRHNHGALRLKNVLVSAAGSILAIIAWEDCISSVAPHWDFSLALHDLSIDEKEQFLAGYGVSSGMMRKCAPVVKAINIVNYAPVVERQEQRHRSDRLDQLRTRLSGALDLYSLS